MVKLRRRSRYPREWQRVNWSGREDLNLRPPAPKAGALPGCATPRLNRNIVAYWQAICFTTPVAKITTLKEAIAEFVHDGDTLALEGFSHLIPFAAGHEIIRQRRRDLTLIRLSADIIVDQMIGMGCAGK